MDPAGPQPQESFDDYLNRTLEVLNKAGAAEHQRLAAAFHDGMTRAREVFEAEAFRKPTRARRSPINRALFESWSVELARLRTCDADEIARRANEVRDRFRAIFEEREAYRQSISVGTADLAKIRLRFEVVREVLKSVLSQQVDEESPSCSSHSV